MIYLALLAVGLLLAFGFWQIGWRGGKPELGRDGDSAGNSPPMW
jgi:hypothetical protein